MKDTGDVGEACHGAWWFNVFCGTVWAAQMAVGELCLMLCPDRDTLLGVSTRYLWVQGDQWFNGSMVQMRPRRPSRDRGQEGSKESNGLPE